MIKVLQKDSHVLGTLIGVILPLIGYALLYLLNMVVLSLFELNIFEDETILRLLSIVFNLIPLRYYLVKVRKDQTGRGVFLATFIYVIVYFSMY